MRDVELFEIDLESVVTSTAKAVMIRHPSGVELWLPRSMVIEMGEVSVLVPLDFVEERGIDGAIAKAEASTAEFAGLVGVS